MNFEIFEFDGWFLTLDVIWCFEIMSKFINLCGCLEWGPRGLDWVLYWFQTVFVEFEIVDAAVIAFAMIYSHMWDSHLRLGNGKGQILNWEAGVAFATSEPLMPLHNFDQVVRNLIKSYQLWHLQLGKCHHFWDVYFTYMLSWREMYSQLQRLVILTLFWFIPISLHRFSPLSKISDSRNSVLGRNLRYFNLKI